MCSSVAPHPSTSRHRHESDRRGVFGAGLSAAEARTKPFIASMGIYVFKKDLLVKLLKEDHIKSNDFGGEIIPAAAKDHKVG